MTNSSQVNAGTVSAATTSVAHNRSNAALAPAEKPAKFSGRFINENVPVMSDETPPEERFLDDLYNVYSNMKTSKELWDALEKKYKTEDAGMKKFIVAKFLDYKMIDRLVVNYAFQVATIIEKLPPLWKDFKNYLKHKRKEMTVEDLMKRKKASDPKSNPPKKKFNGSCFNCGKRGHKATECRGPKKDKKQDQANLAESKGEMDDLYAMLSECNLVGNPREWWIDSGASCHVCVNKELFSSYTPAPTDEKLFMAIFAVAKVEGTGKILLKMTSGKVVTLNRVSFTTKLVGGGYPYSKSNTQ
ncbi:uncharacterized protein LOC125828429 [Solanum verrucosum]|uniref:uncharacterized protein LOC125828429 n=1 Tax=Solanum verrucosum TaxID=315347 RepID=UPI0020D03CA6|nr:uncharacterized protein LOC125828429 [Solanum verrucosum]